MKERGIILNDAMVRAIREGRKTQMRRVVKPRPDGACSMVIRDIDWLFKFQYSFNKRCPYGQPGDRLWVREAHYVWSAGYKDGTGRHIDYRATEPDSPCGGWTPSIRMPRWASRILLEITNVRVERVQDISADDAMAEGIDMPIGLEDAQGFDPRYAFKKIWGSIYGEPHIETDDEGNEIGRISFDWNANPWVWVIEFKRVTA